MKQSSGKPIATRAGLSQNTDRDDLQETEKNLLLSMYRDMASIKDKKGILQAILPILNQLFATSNIFICILDKTNETLNPFLRVGDEERMKHPGYESMTNFNFPVHDGFIDTILRSDIPLVFDIEEVVAQWSKAPEYMAILKDAGLAESLSLALYDGENQIGILTLWSARNNSFRSHHLGLMHRIADQMSIVVTNILANEAIRQRENENAILLQLSNEIAAIRNKEDLSRITATSLKQYIGFDDCVLLIYIKEKDLYNIYTYHVGDKRREHTDFQADLMMDYSLNTNNLSNSHIPVVIDVEELIRKGNNRFAFINNTGIKELATIKLIDGSDLIGLFVLLSEQHNTFTRSVLSILQRISFQISTAVAKLLANEKIEQQLKEINQYKQQLEEEKLYLQEQIETKYNYGEIIGSSKEIQQVFHLLSQVAFTDSTVLLLGETGTGKEIIARAIHNASPRKDRLMIKVNCATLPANLVESELFGHEKGSFTGAVERRIGKFELANCGTLFLDEIGEMPLDLQVKLLRAIQEKEIERVGGKNTIKTDVRIIAATNRDLEKEVAEGRFRSDLYYRLNVFPILLPPLRHRKEDIPLLVAHFLKRYAKMKGKLNMYISKMAMNELMAYHWPGNIRELEHLVERSVLLAQSDTIKEIHLPKLLKDVAQSSNMKSLEEHERDYILEVLERCNGKVFGKGGAAEILNIHVSTLNSRMKKLGIKKGRYFG